MRFGFVNMGIVGVSCLLGSVWLLSPVQAGTQIDQNLAVQESRATFDAMLDEVAKKSRAGVILDVQGCGISYRAARGVANRKTKIPMPIDEPLRIGSISKLYVAAVIHDLAAKDALDLDQPIKNYIDPKMGKGVPNMDANLRQLLNHTSGIPDYYDLRSYLFWDWKKPITPERALKVARRRKATNAPGAAYSYSNTNYQLLALAAEKVTGRKIEVLIETVIGTPLNLKNTRYHRSHPGGTIHGYGTVMRSWADTWALAENTGADGGMTVTSKEVGIFLKALFLKEGVLKRLGDDMLADQVQAESPRRFDGAGAEIYQGRDGLQLIGHTGDVFGYVSFGFAIPEYDVTLVGHLSVNKPKLLLGMLAPTVKTIRKACNK